MVCGDSTIIAKVAMIVMIISVVCSTIAIFTPYWNETEGSNGDKIYTGLVVECNNTLGVCVSLQDILDKYGNSRKLYCSLQLNFVIGLICFDLGYFKDTLIRGVLSVCSERLLHPFFKTHPNTI